MKTEEWLEYVKEIRKVNPRNIKYLANYPNCFKCFKFDIDVNKKCGKILIAALELEKKLINIYLKYGENFMINDFYIYNLANYYIALKMYIEAEKIFDYGFRDFPQIGLFNLPKSLIDFISKLVIENNLELANKIYKKYKTYFTIQNNVIKYLKNLKKLDQNKFYLLKKMASKNELLSNIFKNSNL